MPKASGSKILSAITSDTKKHCAAPNGLDRNNVSGGGYMNSLPKASEAVYRFDKNPRESYKDALKRSGGQFNELAYKLPDYVQDDNNFTNMAEPAGRVPSYIYSMFGGTPHDKGENLATDMYGHGGSSENTSHSKGAGLAHDMFGGRYSKDVTSEITFDGETPSNFGSAGKNPNILDVCALFDYMDYSLDEKKRWSKNYCDCSSYVVRVYSALGKKITDDDTTAAGIAKWLDDKGQRINKEDLQVGDLIFWAQHGDNDRYHNISHIAIFAGYNEKGEAMMWESAPSGHGVILRPVLFQGEPLQYARVP